MTVRTATRTKTAKSAKTSVKSKPQGRSARDLGVPAAGKKTLLALDASYAASLDASVPQVIQEARELEVIAKKHGTTLLSGTLLDKKTLDSLQPRRELLEGAETVWVRARAGNLDKGLADKRAEAETLKSDMIASLRYFCAGDAAIQKVLDDISEGSGLPDLIDDLRQLAPLWDANPAALKKAAPGKKASAKALALADDLAQTAAEQATDAEVTDALELRNRAFWHLREAMDAIRAAGRYIYRGQPRFLTLFRSSSTRRQDRNSRKAAAKTPKKATPTDPPKA